MNEILVRALAGGLVIGLASVLLLALSGRIAGISGIFWSALSSGDSRLWRVLFVAGLMGGAALAHALLGLPRPPPSAMPTAAAIAGGLLVGFGVRLGNGCTSGHGVCGIGLLSRRSLAATLTFMSAGIITVTLVRHGLGSP